VQLVHDSEGWDWEGCDCDTDTDDCDCDDTVTMVDDTGSCLPVNSTHQLLR